MYCTTTDFSGKWTEVRLFTRNGLITEAAKKDPYVWMFVLDAVQRALHYPRGACFTIFGELYHFNGL